MNDINNSINFTARMDVSKVALNKSRWQKIAALFEEKTQKYPNDTFHMTELPTSITAYNVNSKTGEEISADFSGETYDQLMNLSDKEIVAKFKKLLKISETKAKIYEKTQKFINSITQKDADNFEEIKLWDLVVNKANKDAQKTISKDPILKNADILH